MFFDVFVKKLARHLNHQNLVFQFNWLDRLEPGLEMLPFNNILDDF
jgi:hypothetical protein